MYVFGNKVIEFQRFKDTFPDFETYKTRVKENLFDDTQFTDGELELSYYLLQRYWLSSYAYADEDIFVLEHAQKVMFNLPKLLSQMDAMDTIRTSNDFNLTNQEVTTGTRNTVQEAENDRLHKFNNTPKLGQNVDLISDEFLTSSDRDNADSNSTLDETVNNTKTMTDTPYKQLLEKLKTVDYTFIQSYIEKFRQQFMQTTIGSPFYQ